VRPLLGVWRYAGRTPLGATKCERLFAPVLNAKFIELRATWRLPSKSYEEIALFGANRDGQLAFWSFTADGGCSSGPSSQAPEVHPQCVCFEAKMPAGLARMLYWPHENEGFWFAVESRTKKGWRRFIHQHFKPARD
jgi:hypothetical protein